jgi:tetratricopeptide (TPR) repeat protein
VEVGINKNIPKAIKYIDNYLDDHYNNSAQQTLSGLYFQNGQVNKGLKAFDKLIEVNPMASGFLYSLATIYEKGQMFNEAHKYIKKAIELMMYVFLNQCLYTQKHHS